MANARKFKSNFCRNSHFTVMYLSYWILTLFYTFCRLYAVVWSRNKAKISKAASVKLNGRTNERHCVRDHRMASFLTSISHNSPSHYLPFTDAFVSSIWSISYCFKIFKEKNNFENPKGAFASGCRRMDPESVRGCNGIGMHDVTSEWPSGSIKVTQNLDEGKWEGRGEVERGEGEE